jgi:hypothetical protein
VTYVFQFGIVFDKFPDLIEGALLTIRLAAMEAFQIVIHPRDSSHGAFMRRAP